MSVDLLIRGRAPWSLSSLFTKGPLLLDRVIEWFKSALGEAALYNVQHYYDKSGKPHVQLYLHPLHWVEITPEGKNAIQVYGQTSPLGPGYHRYLCDTVNMMGKALNLKWKIIEEDTGYFQGGDPARIEEMMLMWLGACAKRIVELRTNGEYPRINMNLDEGFQFEGILTPMGPRDDVWLEQTAANPNLGIDIFPWWDFDMVRAFKSWAEAFMWTEIRWRKPLNKGESKTLGLVCAWLDEAYLQYPDFAYPWREWLEAMDLCEWEGTVSRKQIEEHASRCEGPLIGYRRRDVTFCKIRPWSIKIPGSFGDDSQEADQFILNDETRRVIITKYSVTGNFDVNRIIEKYDPATIVEKLEFDTEQYKSVALIFKQPDDAQMQSFHYNGTSMMFCTYVHPPECRAWAIETWHSVKFHDSKPTYVQEHFGDQAD